MAPTTGSFGVNQNTGSDMNIKILGTGNTTSQASIAYVTVTPSSQDKQVLRARMSADYTAYAINSNSTGSTVFDFIYLQASATNANAPDAGADNVITLVTSRSTSSSTDNGTPPTYGILLAVVTVANGATAITNANVSDRRTQVTLNIGSTSNTNGWNTLNFPLTYGVNNGNKEFTVTSANDLRGTLSTGMKLSLARSITPPTQCMSFTAASSQYAIKTSPSGITFTGAFTCEAWVYLNSYNAGTEMTILRKSDASNGFSFSIYTSGQARVFYGASSNFTDFVTYQSIPLNRWVHIAAVVTSVSGKTGAIYINGVSVPITNTTTAATTITQAGNLAIGANPAATNLFFDGYVSEARIWSTNQSTANVQSNMTKSLVGNESNLVGLFQGNGNFNDATTNANNLTANGGAIATQANNPYNSTEYGVITNISYSAPTTTLTVFTGTDYMVPNQTLNTPQYSLVQAPYGFPADANRWRVDSLFIATQSTSIGSFNAWFASNAKLSIPTGKWSYGYNGLLTGNGTSSSNMSFEFGLTSATTPDKATVTGAIVGPTTTFVGYPSFIRTLLSLSALTTYTLTGLSSNAGGTVTWGLSNDTTYAQTTIFADCSYI